MPSGIIGNPLIRGKSDIIESCVFNDGFADTIAAGVAVSTIGQNSLGNYEIVPFNGSAFFGFVVANDLNKTQKTASVIRAGFSVPLPYGATMPNRDQSVGVDADGLLVPADDATAVVVINGNCRRSSGINALDANGVTSDVVTIDFALGHSPAESAQAGG